MKRNRFGVNGPEQRFVNEFLSELMKSRSQDSFKVLREVAINGCGEADVVIFSRQKNGGFFTTAFEAKMNDWRRGLLQAARYRAYANVAILVVPVNTATRALRFLDTFRAVKIGLWSFDEQSKKIYRHYNLPVCSLYNEGFTRLGCIGCPLASKTIQAQQFERWPRFAANWKAAVIKNWENYRHKKNKDGRPSFQSKFKAGEAFWHWWLNSDWPSDVFRDGCQTGLLWTNDPDDD